MMLALCFSYLYLSRMETGAELSVFDVGQGDALALRTPTGKTIVIDGGPDWSSLYGLGRWLGLTNKKIDILILSHSHDDHIAALPEIVSRYGVASAYLPAHLEKPAAQSLIENLKAASADIIYPINNTCLILEPDCSVCIYPPSSKFINSPDENDLSLITYINCDGLSLLSSGDAGVKREEELIASGLDLSAKILKASHHGSKTANSMALFEAVKPIIFLISVGNSNNYGHPSPEVLTRAMSIVLNIWETDKKGSAYFFTNNKRIYLKMP